MRLIAASVLALTAVLLSTSPRSSAQPSTITQADRDYAIALVEGIDRAWPGLNYWYANWGSVSPFLTPDVAQTALDALQKPAATYQSHATAMTLEHETRIWSAALKFRENLRDRPFCPDQTPGSSQCGVSRITRRQNQYDIQWFKNILEIEARELRAIINQ